MTLQKYKENKLLKFKEYYHDVSMNDEFEYMLISSIINSANIDLFIDVGVNQGDVTNFVLSQKKLDLIGFEPDKRIMEKTKENLKGKNVKLYPYAVWKRNGIKKLYINEDSTQSSLIFPLINRGFFVRTVKLDNYYNLINSYNNIFIKIDTEGAEPEVFEGMKKIFRKLKKPLFIIFEYSHKWLQSEREKHKIFTDFFTNSFKLFRLNTFGLERLGSDMNWQLKKYHYSLILASKNMNMLNAIQQIPSENGLIDFIPITKNVNLDFSMVEEKIYE